MKYVHLIFASLLRKKIRTTLTISSFAGALFLFGILTVIQGAFTNPIGAIGTDRLLVVSRVSPIPIQPLPISYRDRILRIPGVTGVTSAYVSPGFHQDDRVFIMQEAIDVEHHRSIVPEFHVPDDQWAAFVADREGCIIGEALARRFQWKIGDRVPVKSAVARFNALEFNIRGIYHAGPGVDARLFWYQRTLIEEMVPAFKGFAGWYVVRVVRPDVAARVSQAIDQEFANSPSETRTTTENQFGAAMANQMGNVRFLILSIGGVVLAALLMVTGNTMAIAVRERVGEFALLKAIGFSDAAVLLLVLVESLVIAAVGGGVGLALAKLFTLRGDPTGGLLVSFHLSGLSIARGFVLALLVGALAGFLPAVSAMRLRVVHAMRRV